MEDRGTGSWRDGGVRSNGGHRRADDRKAFGAFVVGPERLGGAASGRQASDRRFLGLIGSSHTYARAVPPADTGGATISQVVDALYLVTIFRDRGRLSTARQVCKIVTTLAIATLGRVRMAGVAGASYR